MKIGIGAVVAALALAATAFPTPSPAAAEGQLGPPRVTPLGTFGGIAYVQYDGLFEGQTSTGAYRVPYRISAPADPVRGNRAVLAEPPHFAVGLSALELYLGQDFLFSRGFGHAGIGWSTISPPPGGDRRILDPTAPDMFIAGGVAEGNGRTGDEIISDFARAVASDPAARRLLGRVERRYLSGFSDSSDPVLRLVTSGRAAGRTIAISPGAMVVTVSVQGLNFVHLQRDGTTVSAGRRDLTLTFALDEQGNVTGPPPGDAGGHAELHRPGRLPLPEAGGVGPSAVGTTAARGRVHPAPPICSGCFVRCGFTV